MTMTSCNCIVCAEEFSSEQELQSLSLSKVNMTNFKICEACLDKIDPANDYTQAREIVQNYLSLANAKILFAEAKDILDSIKK